MNLFADKDTGENRYPLSAPLTRISRAGDYVRLVDLVRGGVLITGSPGSGKTSATFNMGFLWPCLESGHGTLILACKDEAVEEAKEIAGRAGRSRDVIEVTPKSHTFPFIDYAVAHHHEAESVIQECVEILWASLQPMRRDSGRSSGENPFFSNAGRRLIGKLMLLDRIAEGSISVLRLLRMIQSIPPSISDVENVERFYLIQQVAKAQANCPNQQAQELMLAVEHVAVELVNLNSETKSSITITATTELAPLLDYPLFQMFSGTQPLITPDVILDGAVLVLNCTVAEYPVAGRVAGCIWKRSLQNAVLRRIKQQGRRTI
jgi:hypothetical protein